ncbi:flagellar export chaperone FliS [Vallitalea pronyensis]|uniref:Flagellar secretion chaperone FliS n=1 Tax=Vallitalea pronyensis TaxID=1348613 RepID=A0A8J8MH35_9FIRM|nr:flagellar export chaperone FliS [Vallitalea pronyensis]QUI21459.1 flagellar export chaperone FliS [Vallitalea pronyensis]
MVNNGYNQYQNNAILTASPQELTLMLYNGAIKFCNQAIQAIDNQDIETAHELIIRVEDIIEEFIITLDDKYPIAETFKNMYDYIHQRLIEANMNKDKTILEEVLGYLRELRDTWKEAMKLAKNPNPKVTNA